MAHTSRIELTIDQHIATVSLNRPEKHNGLDLPMLYDLIATAKTLKKNKTIRAVVLQGHGASFCAGLDFGAVMKNPKAIIPAFLKLPWRKTNVFQEAVWAWRELPMPVIAAVHGNCFGGGIQIALGADFRFIAPDAQISVMEIKWGIIPDMAGTPLLNELLPLDKIKDLVMTGRIISGKEAVDINLGTWLSDDPQAAALAYAQTLCAQSPDALMFGKRLLAKNRHTSPRKAFRRERIYQSWLLAGKNQKIALKAGMKKQAANYQDRRL